jgi:predicted kinase
MKKIIVLQGPPACGKSTRAKQLHEEDINNVIVCRDSIRESRGQYWLPEQESYIDKVEMLQVESALECGLTPVIDATNLNKKTIKKWEDLAKLYNANVEYIECVLPYDIALERDSQRERQVGEKVLRNFYQKYYPHLLRIPDDRNMKEFDLTKTPCIICDLDGTIALGYDRGVFEYDKCESDKPDFRVIQMLENLWESKMYNKIIFLSGRDETGRVAAEKWLSVHVEIPREHWELKLRKKHDYRSDDVLKKEIYEKQIEPYYDVKLVLEDRDKVVKMWRDLGLLCCQVYYGKF